MNSARPWVLSYALTVRRPYSRLRGWPQMRRPLARSFQNAFRGIIHTLRSQRNARIHLGAASLVVGLGVWLGLEFLEWAVLVLTIGVVVAVEMVNTALEALSDAVCPDHHPLVGIGKDVAAGAVLVAAVAAVVVGLLIFVPRLARLPVP